MLLLHVRYKDVLASGFDRGRVLSPPIILLAFLSSVHDGEAPAVAESFLALTILRVAHSGSWFCLIKQTYPTTSNGQLPISMQVDWRNA